MIKFNDRFAFERDKWCWTLHEYKKGVNKKTKEEVETVYDTYYPTLEQVCKAIIDRTAGDAQDAKDLRRVIRNVADELGVLIKAMKEGGDGK